MSLATQRSRRRETMHNSEPASGREDVRMRHARCRMCHQKTAPDSKADIKKETIMAPILRWALISVVVSLLMAVPPIYAESRKHSTSKLWTFADTEAVPGARSRLFRSNDKICRGLRRSGEIA
jgi:hypothetical protein